MSPPTPSISITLSADKKSFTYTQSNPSFPSTSTSTSTTTLQNFHNFVHSVIADAYDILVHDLLFSSSFQFPLMSSLQDDIKHHYPGYSFLQAGNGLFPKLSAASGKVYCGYTDIIANIHADPRGAEMLISTSTTTGTEPDPSSSASSPTPTKKSLFLTRSAALAYEATATKFLKLLLVAILVSAGVPPYGDDLLHVRLVDEEHFHRSIYISRQSVMIMTSDGGRPAIAAAPQPVLRFLPEQVGVMVLLYMTDVLPLLRSLGTVAAERLKGSNFLFAETAAGTTGSGTGSGTAGEGAAHQRGMWSMRRYEEILRRETRKRMGIEMGLDGYKALFLELAKVNMPGGFDAEGYVRAG
jgi:hypothetical protein